MNASDRALQTLAKTIGTALGFDQEDQIALEFDDGRILVLHRHDEQTLAIRIDVLHMIPNQDPAERAATLAAALSLNYQIGAAGSRIGLCEASQSLVLFRWLCGEALGDIDTQVAQILEEAQHVEAQLVDRCRPRSPALPQSAVKA